MSRLVFICIAVLLAVVGPSTEQLTQCYHEPTNHYYPLNEKYNPIGYCEQFSCKANGAYTQVVCPATLVGFDDDCKYVEKDLTKPFPDCCDKCT